MDLVIEEVRFNDCALVRLAGEFDVWSAPKAKAKFLDLIDDGVKNIAVDLRNVEFMDSSGMGVLLGCYKRLKGVDGKLVILISEKNTHIAKVLRITGLNKVFAVRVVGETQGFANIEDLFVVERA